MSQLDFAQGGPFPVTHEPAIVSMLFILRDMRTPVVCNIATVLSLLRCYDGVCSRSPVTFIKDPLGADLGSL